MLDKGYRNTQLTDVYARTVEPPVHRLPRQVYLWSSSFLQSCYYFDPLLKSPLKVIRRFINRRMVPADLGSPCSGASRCRRRCFWPEWDVFHGASGILAIGRSFVPDAAAHQDRRVTRGSVKTVRPALARTWNVDE